uniref:Uncharacterized protein n=1 Tax=Ascaris lumbricoides TaxID=6252 RepID=A0A0M3IPT1_ASCLU
MNLRDLNSNSAALRERWKIEDRQKETNTKILGIPWNVETDKISFIFKQFESSDITKRTLLSWVASIFDPLGYLTPATLPIKVFIQSLWRMEYGWDEALKEAEFQRANALIQGWHSQPISIKRQIGQPNLSEVHWMDNNFVVVFNDPRVSGDFRQWIKSHPVEISRMNWLHLTRTNPSSTLSATRHVNSVQEYTTIFANSLQSSEAHDPINAKLQFAYELLRDQINEQFRIVWKSICELTNAFIINAKSAPPTVAARMLLQREDVCATLRDAGSLLIYPCNEKAIESFDNFSSTNVAAIRYRTFKAGPLPSVERERISLALSMLSTEMKRSEKRNTLSNEIGKSGIDSLRDEGERLLWEAESEIGVAAHKIQEALDDVSRVAIKTTIIVSVFIALGVGAVLGCRCLIKRRTKQVQVQIRVPEIEDTAAKLKEVAPCHITPQRTLQDLQFNENTMNFARQHSSRLTNYSLRLCRKVQHLSLNLNSNIQSNEFFTVFVLTTY